jgi:hypothetical protein
MEQELAPFEAGVNSISRARQGQFSGATWSAPCGKSNKGKS